METDGSAKDGLKIGLGFLIKEVATVLKGYSGKKNRPMTDFQWICELDQVKGVKIMKYRNRKKAGEFVSSIAKVEDKKDRGNFMFPGCA